MDQKLIDKTLEIVRAKGIFRSRDLVPYEIPREYLRRLSDRGLIDRVGRGLYVSAGVELTEHHTIAEACKRIPHGIICLLTALQFHGITTQAPFEIWMALEKKARQPLVDHPLMRFVRFSGAAFESGIERHLLEGVEVKIYNPAKTVADCFKYRNKIGLDVALEALRECRRQRKCANDELWHYAKICRVANVMKPYLEALI